MENPVLFEGMGRNAPIATNERGGQQSALPYRYDLMDGIATAKLAEVLAYGASKYAPNNWRLIDTNSHLNHMLAHVFAYLGGDTQDDHLEHMLCRAHMAVAVKYQPTNWQEIYTGVKGIECRVRDN